MWSPPGLASLSVEGLESQCSVRGTIDLTDEKGRKQVGGKLEIAATLREPLSGEWTSHVTLS